MFGSKSSSHTYKTVSTLDEDEQEKLLLQNANSHRNFLRACNNDRPDTIDFRVFCRTVLFLSSAVAVLIILLAVCRFSHQDVVVNAKKVSLAEEALHTIKHVNDLEFPFTPTMKEYHCSSTRYDQITYQTPTFTLPPHNIPFVTETERGTCNLIGNGLDQCAGNVIQSGSPLEPDRFLLDLIDIVLHSCKRLQCDSIDIGSNLGLVTLSMLHAGSNVIAIEPQPDICCSLYASAAFNSWNDKLTVLCGGAAVDDSGDKFLTLDAGYRPGDGYIRRNDSFLWHYKQLGLSNEVPLYGLKSFMKKSFYNFIKVDTDSVDDLLAQAMLQDETLDFDTMTFEVSSGLFLDDKWFGKFCWQAQKLGYYLYKTPADSRHYSHEYITKGEKLQIGTKSYLWKLPQQTEEEWLNQKFADFDLATQQIGEFHVMITKLDLPSLIKEQNLVFETPQGQTI